MKAIVYQSNTGHTEKYAELLSSDLNIPFYSLDEAKGKLAKNDEIIFLGWIFATKIKGLNKALKRYAVRCCGAVGVYPASDSYVEDLKKANNADIPIFYMRGGINYDKLKVLYKKMFQMVGKAMEKDNSKDVEMMLLFKNGANYVNEDNLKPLIDYINKV